MNFPSVGMIERRQQVHQRALAAAAASDQCGHHAGGHVDVDPTEHGNFDAVFVIALEDAACLQNRV